MGKLVVSSRFVVEQAINCVNLRCSCYAEDRQRGHVRSKICAQYVNLFNFHSLDFTINVRYLEKWDCTHLDEKFCL